MKHSGGNDYLYGASRFFCSCGYGDDRTNRSHLLSHSYSRDGSHSAVRLHDRFQTIGDHVAPQLREITPLDRYVPPPCNNHQDEYGKGTNPSDGICLLGATIRHLLQQAQQCPKAIICKDVTLVML